MKIDLRDQRFLTIVMDAINLLEESSILQNQLGASLARASIMNSVVVVEAVANCCLFATKASGTLFRELDRLPPLAKLDYFCFAIKRVHIDRGIREVELVSEVLHLRDHIAHPKPKSGELVLGSDEEYGSYGATKNLQIPFDTRQWGSSEAKSVLTTVMRFLSTFFLDTCGLTKGKVTTLLVVRETDLIRKGIDTYVTVGRADFEAVTKWAKQLHEIIDIRVTEKPNE